MKPHRFIFSIAAIGFDNNSSSNLVHTCGITTADNEDEAIEKLLLVAKKRWPKIAGWRFHSVTVEKI